MNHSEEQQYRDLVEELKNQINILEAKIAKSKKKKSKLDPVGKEDEDIDNDGQENTSRDKYLMNRRSKIKKAMSKKKVMKEGNQIISEGIVYGGFPNKQLNKDRE